MYQYTISYILNETVDVAMTTTEFIKKQNHFL